VGKTIPYTARTAATSHSLVVTGTAANVEAVKITDTNGKVTGKAGSVHVVPTTIGTLGTATVSVAATLLAGQAVTVAVTSTAATGATTNTITGAASVNTTLAVTDGTRRVAAGSTNTLVVNVKDQFGSNVAGASVTASVAGRNPKVASTILTDASGNASYALADTGTVGTTDTVTFTSTASTTATLSYGSTDVTTLTIAGPNTDDLQVLLAEKTNISTAVAGASGTVATVTVTAKDAAGLVMAGIPVTFTVAGTTAAILSTKVTVYTGAAGTAATSVYAWANGAYVVTATAGGKTATDTVHFAQQTATSARTIAATVDGSVVTATVKDRYGNPVPAVTVWATKTGIGYFGSGAGVTSGTTNEAGQAQFFINGASADTTVKVALGSATGTDLYYGQSGSLLGYVTQGDGGTSTIVTATTVGTTTTAETGVGAAFAPAGINSATVTVVGSVSEASTAADAAAEATDAANAATDAANAAAEAADAATAAAQDAADAVAALSTQVSEMVDALKKQITALTNLVIKIQKKVKA
jgi:trimeric autotransporter adhesin